MNRIFEITDPQLNRRNLYFNFFHVGIGVNRNIYFINNIYKCLFVIIKTIVIIYYIIISQVINPMTSIKKMGSILNNKSVKKCGRIEQNILQVYTKIKIDDKNDHNKKNVTKRVNDKVSKKKSHSNDVRYITPKKTIDNEEKLYSTQKISKKQIKNKNKSVNEAKLKKKVIDFSAVLDISEPTKKKVTFNDPIIKQYISNQPSRSIMSKNIAQLHENGLSTNNIHHLMDSQSERLEKLRKYLLSDTERMTKIKKQSDEHAIEQLNVSQKNLFKTMQQLNSQKELIKIQGERLLKDTKDRYEQQIELNYRQISNLKDQLTHAREINNRVESKLKQSEIKMTNIKEQLQIKQKQCQVLNGTIDKLRNQRNNFESQLKKCLRQKEIIKSQVQEVLGVVRQEIYNNMESV